MSKAITTAYVFAQSPSGAHELAGILSQHRTAGTFTYSQHWLEQPWAYPLDPVNLKLQPDAIITTNANQVHPVFSDAGPDDWGTKVLLAGHTRLPANETERLLATSGHGVGCLRFSLSRSRPKEPSPPPSLELLHELEDASQKIANNQTVDPALLALLIPATSMGGARPKITLREHDKDYIAKFSKPGDLINVPRVEYACMRLAQQCGINIPDIRLQTLGERDAFIIQRFDRHEKRQLHYISAHSLFNRDRVRLYDNAYADPCSYIALSKMLRTHARDWNDTAMELFRRIVFNVYIGNIDDHGRNHGCLYDPANPGWQLSAAFDIVPTVSQGREHALGIGRFGRQRSMGNVMSAAEGFGLSGDEAKGIVDEVVGVASGWRIVFQNSGVESEDTRIAEQIIGIF
ncbi:type II toxin-antitoxin system HipA family toxin [Gammaproteobacteria bacterium LSUCC0112]|nr:type II toxin-antitoxin system HipA family toxin [Gammaproteobacteria bacterium LSUCC0112]